MGLQFGISFGLSDEVNQFAAVGRDEMAGRSGQVRSLLDFAYSCLVPLSYLTGLLPKPISIGRSEIRLQILRERKAPKNVTQQSITYCWS